MSELTSNNYTHLRWFNDGLFIENCIDLCSPAHGRFMPSKPEGQVIKKGDLRSLKAKGLITDTIIIHFGVKHIRYLISEFGRKVFEEYRNVHSK